MNTGTTIGRVIDKDASVLVANARRFACGICLPAVLLIPGCTRQRPEIPMARDSTTVPYQEIEKSTLYLYDGPRLVWTLRSDFLRRPIVDTGKTLAYPVVLNMYDSLGRNNSRILADSGYTNTQKDRFTVWGNVYVKTQDSMVVKAERLDWSRLNHRVTSDTHVQIETPKGDVLRGKGLDADENFSSWRFLADVSGHFPNFKERIDNNETIGGTGPSPAAAPAGGRASDSGASQPR